MFSLEKTERAIITLLKFLKGYHTGGDTEQSLLFLRRGHKVIELIQKKADCNGQKNPLKKKE